MPTADLLLYGGKILTLSLTRPTAEAVAIADGRILAIGREQDLRTLASPQTEKISVAGKTVLPGFIDPHLHLFSWASRFCGVDLSNSDSVAEIQSLLIQQISSLSPDDWLRGYGYDEFYLAENRHPTRDELDAVSPTHPIIIRHRTGHAAVLNSAALQRAGIDHSFTPRDGGIVERERCTGEPTGAVYELEPFLRTVIPPLSQRIFNTGLQQACSALVRCGITSFHDAGSGNTLADFQVFQQLYDSSTLSARSTVMIGIGAFPQIIEAGLAPFSGDDWVNLGSIKIMVHEARGEVYPSPEELTEMVWHVHRHGFQVAIHTVEEGPICAGLAAISNALQRQQRADHRHRLEHCALCPPPFVSQLAECGVTVVTQPGFLYFYGDKYAAEIAPEQQDWLYRTKSLLARGVPVAGSSDCPIAPLSPLLGIQATMQRASYIGTFINQQEALPLIDALTLFTSAGAWVSFAEHQKGKILPGMLADVVVLDRDILKTPVEEIGQCQVEMTLVGGKAVWKK